MGDPGQRVVIIGGGFGGATLAQHLESELGEAAEIVVISRDNHLVFTPMLAEVAARAVSPFHVLAAGRQMTRRTRWIAAEATALNLSSRTVTYESRFGGQINMEFGDLVLACGMDVNLDAVPGMAAHALPLKSIEEAFALGNALIGRFEQAATEADPLTQAKLLTCIVVGGGFSGVEIAGHLHDLGASIRPYYRFAEGVCHRTIVLHRGERVIPEFRHEALSDYALRKMRANGVEVQLKTGVREVSKTEVHLSDGSRIAYGLLVGTIGTAASDLIRNSGLPLERNRVRTNGSMQVEPHPSVWALGDCAAVPNAFEGNTSPPTAQFAIRQAKQLAANLRRAREKRELIPFRFRPQGLLASIGHRNGVAEIYGLKFSGLFAWFLWRAVYLMKMPSLASKMGIGIDWFFNALFPQNLVRIGEAAAQIRKERYVAGDIVYRMGEPSRTLYLIENGSATVHIDDAREPVARIQKGEHFGVSAIERQETTRTSTMRAESTLELIAFERPRLRELSNDALSPEMLRLLELRRMRESWKTLLDRLPEIATLHVEDCMVENPPVLNEADTLMIALEKLALRLDLAVVDIDHRLTGLCSRHDVNAALVKGAPLETPIGELKSTASITFSPRRPLGEAINELLRTGLFTIPVVADDQRLVGAFGMVEAAYSLLVKRGRQLPDKLV